MQTTLLSTRARHLAARLVIVVFCSALFGGAPMTIAYAQSVSTDGTPHVPTVRVAAREALAQDARDETSFTQRRHAATARVAASRMAARWAREMRLRALKDARFRAEHLCPVDHPRIFSDDYGDPRKGDHIHLGNDIVAPKGTPIRAPIDGLVTHGIDPRGGTILKLWGNGGHFYMAHLSAYGKDGRVRAGDIIGYVGDSGEAKHGPPHNHVEWHPRNGKAVNPYRLLVSLCGARTWGDLHVAFPLLGLPRHRA